MKKELSHKGFTLVELMIVMAIIGLLVGAVLKGQAMINDAKRTRLMNDIQGISSAYFTYYDRYNALPGDDPVAHGWGIALGNASGYIDGAAQPTPTAESEVAWRALRYSMLLSGDPTAAGAAALPRNPYGGAYGFSFLAFGAGVGTRNYVIATNIPGSVAEAVDIKVDDGIYNTGTVRGSADYGTAFVNLQYAL